MSTLPGLGLLGPTSDIKLAPETRNVVLEPGTEWRFEVPADSTVTVKLLPASQVSDGTNGVEDDMKNTAEVFGTELAPNHSYEFASLTKAAIFTYFGCTLTVTGKCEVDYVAEETCMSEYVNVHFALENLRSTAEANQTDGPRVLIVGAKDAGKTTLVKILTAYAVKVGQTPLVINLDPREGTFCLPASISAAVMGTGAVLDVEDAASSGWGSSPISGPSALPVKLPLVYHVGVGGPEERPEVFKPVTTRLALTATSRFEGQVAIREAGILVDMAGSACSGKKGAELIGHVMSEFSINVLLVIGSERLFSEMSRRYATSNGIGTYSTDEKIHVLKVSRSGGCVDREESYLKQLQQLQIRNYFFGGPNNPLSPHTSNVDFNALNIFRLIDPNETNYELLPGGAEDDDNYASRIFERVTPSLAMNSTVLAIKHASPNESEEAIRDASVMGYLYVADVDEAKSRVRILSPIGGNIPPNALVWGLWDGAEGVGILLV